MDTFPANLSLMDILLGLLTWGCGAILVVACAVLAFSILRLRRHSRPRSIEGALFLVAAPLILPCCFAGFFTTATNSSVNLIRQGVSADGIVIQNISKLSQDGTGTYYFPVVEFTSADGREVSFTANSGDAKPAYEPGEVVRVLYDPNMPERAVIVTWRQLWLFPAIFGGGGLLTLLAGTFLSWLGVRTNRWDLAADTVMEILG